LETTMGQSTKREMGQDYDPRLAVVRDLGKFLEDKRNHDIIIGGDFNGAPMEGEVDKEGTVAWLMGEFGLMDAYAELNDGPSPRTYRHGSRRIDQIYVSDRLLAENIVLQTTIGDFDSFFTSDHRPVIIVLDAATYFGADTQE
jgi:exonuclease III